MLAEKIAPFKLSNNACPAINGTTIRVPTNKTPISRIEKVIVAAVSTANPKLIIPTGTPDTSSTGTVNNVSFTSGYSVPEIDHDTGDVLYIENRTPIQRAPDQTENIKLVIEF